MIPSSVRRVVGVAPQSSPVVSSLAASAIPLSRSSYKPSCHQRRYSSSKPSSKSSSPPSVGSKPSASENAIAMSTFFALHRPISVTQILPKKVSNEAFARIFDKEETTKPNWEDVISTLSQTTQQLQLQQQQMVAATVPGGTKPMFQLETSLQHQLDSMTGPYRPYHPPPAPEPMTMATEQDIAAAAEEQDSDLLSQTTRVYKALVTIEESMDAEGVISSKVVEHSPVVMQDVYAGAGEQQPRSGRFLERMALRQLQYEDARELARRRPSIYAISVKRQRKLKMKKKKYKKLMRKTRNIRRKLDRL
ncbi:hypothetical protein QBC37DRAFT_411703 [Rhypophila decipiens]|uniref:Small ribosomal subunit protein mS38 n=1 Tax=Rhypophila decipiens TaxID=261697 RepID=A0AAN7BCF3_9PEZI|nr:hypothetical protein QBC37DRAFT_411703 [Rhypophila decipiens]